MTEILTAPAPPVPGIHKEEPKVKRKIRTYSLKKLRLRKYEEIEVNPYYAQLFGMPEPRFTMMIYGPSGSGKTRFAYALAEYLGNHGKSLYASFEESTKKTVVDRANMMHMKGNRLWFCEPMDFDDLVDLIKANRYRFVFIDSVQYARLTFAQLQQLQIMFRKRKISFILISFGTSLGKTMGADDLLYASDIKLFFKIQGKTGTLTAISRYKEEVMKIKLFRLNETEIVNPDVPDEVPVASVNFE